MDANTQQYIESNLSLGSIPSAVSAADVSQVMELGLYSGTVGNLSEYAYLKGGKVYAFFEEVSISFDMGDPVIDKNIIEFTARPHNAGFIFTVKNSGGLARDVYPTPNGAVYGDITDHVIKVAAGKMLVQDGIQDPQNYKPLYAIAVTPDPNASQNSQQVTNYIPLGANNQLDMYVGIGNVTDVFLDNKITDTLKIIENYTLKTNGDLLKDGKKIDSNVNDIGMLNNQDTLKMTRTSSEYANFIENIYSTTLSNPPYMYSSSFINAFIAYFKSHLATCAWSGVAPQGIGSVGSLRPCLVNTNRRYHNGVHNQICYIYKDGTFSSNIQYFSTVDANAFNAIASSSNGGKIQLFGGNVLANANAQQAFKPHAFTDMDITSGNMCIVI